jgi:hypothetical protein
MTVYQTPPGYQQQQPGQPSTAPTQQPGGRYWTPGTVNGIPIPGYQHPPAAPTQQPGGGYWSPGMVNGIKSPLWQQMQQQPMGNQQPPQWGADLQQQPMGYQPGMPAMLSQLPSMGGPLGGMRPGYPSPQHVNPGHSFGSLMGGGGMANLFSQFGRPR